MYCSVRSLLPVVLLLALHIKYADSRSHQCVHDDLDLDIRKNYAYSNDDMEGRVLQSYSSIRIAFDYSSLSGVDETYKSYITDTIMPSSKSFLEKALKVVRLTSKLKTIEGVACDDIPVPPVYQPSGAGIDADLLIFVTYVNDSSVSFLANAGACEIANANNRPIVGKVNFNLAYIIPTTNDIAIREDISTTLHEIVHVLGFSGSLYPLYVNPANNQELTGHILTRTVNGQSITVLNVEPLTTRLRTYFACPTLEGAYIENQGGSGSAGAHFERRIFYNDFMTASSIKDERVTEFSLALLEGTGWYKPDYTMAEPFTWGKGKGCPFLDSTCLTAANTAAFPEFCDGSTQNACSWTRRGRSFCSTYNNSQFIDPFSDNCPYSTVYSNTDCENPADQSTNPIEIYGYGSKCFTGTLNGWTSFCLKPTCEAQNGGGYNIKLQIGAASLGYTATCTSAGSITVPGIPGSVDCPDPITFCNSYTCGFGCMGRGTCVNKVCQCIDGWTGDTCNTKQYKDNCTRCSNGDPFKTFCYGDTCECNPSDLACMCHLGRKTGTQCDSVCKVDGWDPTDCTKKIYKADCTRCALGSDPTKTICYGDMCLSRTVEPDGSKLDTKATKKEDDGTSIGLIIGAAIGGAIVFASGTFFGVKAAKSCIKKRSSYRVTQIKIDQTSVASETNRPGNISTVGDTSRFMV